MKKKTQEAAEDYFDAHVRSHRSLVLSRTTTGFHFATFAAEFCKHCLYPLTLPIPYLTGAVRQWTNQLLLPPLTRSAHRSAYITFLGMFGHGFCVLAAHMLLIAAAPQHYHFFWPLIATLDLLVMMRWSVIAIKYAYFSEVELNLIRHGTYPEAMALQVVSQVVTRFKNADPTWFAVELELLEYEYYKSFSSSVNLIMPLHGAEARQRLCARIKHDVKRLKLDPRIAAAMHAQIPSSGAYISIDRLVNIVRLAVQPRKTGVRWPLTLWTVLLALPLLAIPFTAPFPLRIGTTTKLVWLVPPGYCDCSFSCDAACTCAVADAVDGSILLAALFPLALDIGIFHNFMRMGVLEAYRRNRSLAVWGSLFLSSGFPRSKKKKQRSGRVTEGKCDDRSAASTDADLGEVSEGLHEESSLVEHVDHDDSGSDDNGPYSTMGDADQPLSRAKAETAALQSWTSVCCQSKRAGMQPPLIDTERAESYIAWFLGRTLLCRFGSRYNNRIDAYMSSFLAILLALLVASLMYLLFAELGAINIQIIFCAIYAFVLLAVPLGALLSNLIQGNAANAKDRANLSRISAALESHAAALRQQLGPQSHPFADERARLVQLEACMVQVEKTIMKLEMAEQAEPLKVLFFLPATLKFLSSGIAGASVAGGAVITLIKDALKAQYLRYHVEAAANASQACTAAADGSSHLHPVSGLVWASIGCGALGYGATLLALSVRFLRKSWMVSTISFDVRSSVTAEGEEKKENGEATVSMPYLGSSVTVPAEALEGVEGMAASAETSELESGPLDGLDHTEQTFGLSAAPDDGGNPFDESARRSSASIEVGGDALSGSARARALSSAFAVARSGKGDWNPFGAGPTALAWSSV